MGPEVLKVDLVSMPLGENHNQSAGEKLHVYAHCSISDGNSKRRNVTVIFINVDVENPYSIALKSTLYQLVMLAAVDSSITSQLPRYRAQRCLSTASCCCQSTGTSLWTSLFHAKSHQPRHSPWHHSPWHHSHMASQCCKAHLFWGGTVRLLHVNIK